MCGLTGVFSPDKGREALGGIVRPMTAALAHRGPDAEGFHIEDGLALGHRRLAILDLSDAGTQPMRSASGRFTLVFNGEIYNFRRLAPELEALGFAFRTGTDTEVLLAAIEAWGIPGCLQRLIGMFAFAVFDHAERRLTLVRDRLGVKPLVYGLAGRDFVFGSDCSSLRRHPAFDRSLDRGALTLFARHNAIPAPWTIHPKARKLPPGTWLSLDMADLDGLDIDARKPTPYWTLEDAFNRPTLDLPAEEAQAELDRLLVDAVDLRLVSDAPLGLFLSGGIDSATVAAIAAERSSNRLKTFTIGFDDPDFDEAPHARKIAQALGTDHHEHRVDAAEVREALLAVPALFDEPFADASQAPTWLLARFARETTTVALSGDGGDETFGGYARYFQALRLWRRIERIPAPIRAGLRRVLDWTRPRLDDPASPLNRRRNHLRFLSAPDLRDFYKPLLSHFRDPERAVLGGLEPATVFNQTLDRPDWAPLKRMRFLDFSLYLPDEVLVKVDRATMAVGLEAREPLLDHRIVEFAARLPDAALLTHPQGKGPLRAALHKRLPPSLFERPKRGFGGPIGGWLRTGLRDLLQDALTPAKVRAQGVFHPEIIAHMVQAHLSGKRDLGHHLWDALVLSLWLDANG